MDLTVAICSYNGADRIPIVLERLRSQVETEAICWEVLVIDNNSTDHTAAVVQQFQAQWPSAVPLRYIFEPQQGLAFARQAAIQAAQGQWVGFLDDDNWPDVDWVRAAYEFGRSHPQAGAYGGKVQGAFEVEPSDALKRISMFLALVDLGPQPQRYEPAQRMLPPAAGVVVLKQAWCQSVPSRLRLVGRVGKSMLASEDLEALLYIQTAGWEIWYTPDMQIKHHIPRHRMEYDYLISLVRGVGLARHHIRMIRLKAWQRPIAFMLHFVNDLRKVVLQRVRYHNRRKTDLAIACLMQFEWSSLISPFYLWFLDLSRYFETVTQKQKPA